MNKVSGGTPELSIGLPVYNGEPFLEQALTSLLAQTFTDFELIISDNGSDDGTEEICRSSASNDKRVRYIRHPHNRGAIFNWNFVVAQARGQYFKWASANDYCDPRFLEACLAELYASDNVALCYTRTNIISSDGKMIGLDSQDIEVLDNNPAERFLRMMDFQYRNNAISGVIRTHMLTRTRLNRRYPHGDRVLMAELAARGQFRLINEPLFYRRFDDRSSSVHSLSRDELRTFLAPERRFLSNFDLWCWHLDFLYSAMRAPVPVPDRIKLAQSVLRRIWWRRSDLYSELREYLRPARE